MRREKGGDENEEAEGLQAPSEDSEGEEDQLGKESQLARRVLMVAERPSAFSSEKAEEANLLQERRKRKWKSIQS